MIIIYIIFINTCKSSTSKQHLRVLVLRECSSSNCCQGSSIAQVDLSDRSTCESTSCDLLQRNSILEVNLCQISSISECITLNSSNTILNLDTLKSRTLEYVLLDNLQVLRQTYSLELLGVCESILIDGLKCSSVREVDALQSTSQECTLTDSYDFLTNHERSNVRILECIIRNLSQISGKSD